MPTPQNGQKHSNKLPTNCVFDYFVGLTLKMLRKTCCNSLNNTLIMTDVGKVEKATLTVITFLR